MLRRAVPSIVAEADISKVKRGNCSAQFVKALHIICHMDLVSTTNKRIPLHIGHKVDSVRDLGRKLDPDFPRSVSNVCARLSLSNTDVVTLECSAQKIPRNVYVKRESGTCTELGPGDRCQIFGNDLIILHKDSRGREHGFTLQVNTLLDLDVTTSKHLKLTNVPPLPCTHLLPIITLTESFYGAYALRTMILCAEIKCYVQQVCNSAAAAGSAGLAHAKRQRTGPSPARQGIMESLRLAFWHCKHVDDLICKVILLPSCTMLHMQATWHGQW